MLVISLACFMFALETQGRAHRVLTYTGSLFALFAVLEWL